MINEVISRKRKMEISIPIMRNAHLNRKRTIQYATTRGNSDYTAGLTFVNSQTHTTVHPNLSPNFMLIPEVRFFFCFVISFLFSMPFYSAASVRSIVFCFVLAAKGQRSDIDKIFCSKYALDVRERKIFSKTL